MGWLAANPDTTAPHGPVSSRRPLGAVADAVEPVGRGRSPALTPRPSLAIIRGRTHAILTYMPLNPVDLTFAILLALAVLRGYSKGLLGTAAGYVAPVLAFVMAADWSDPVRERLAAAMPAPDFVLDVAAPAVVFVVVVASVRLGAALLSRLLGVGLSLPGRTAAGAASAVVTGVLLGSLVLVARELKPADDVHRDAASGALVGPFERFVTDLDRRFEESHLAPRLADLASIVVTEAMQHKDDVHLPPPAAVEEFAREATAAAAAAAIRQVPLTADTARKALDDSARRVADEAAKAASPARRAPDSGTAPGPAGGPR